jgi:hypothetical protein
MLCPLKFVIKTDTMARKPEMECSREECAWWVAGPEPDDARCAVKDLAFQIWEINTAVYNMADPSINRR